MSPFQLQVLTSLVFVTPPIGICNPLTKIQFSAEEVGTGFAAIRGKTFAMEFAIQK